MVKVVWTIKAQTRFDSIFETCADDYGIRSANKLYDLVYKKIDRLIKYPLSSSIEPLLVNYQKKFRSCIIRKPLKMVYHYVEESDTLYIDNFWDMRRNPDALKGDI